MSDQGLRELERHWRQDGSDAAGAEYLRACLRQGLLVEGGLRVAALAGSGAARLVLGPWILDCPQMAELLHVDSTLVLKWLRALPGAPSGVRSADLFLVLDALGRPGAPNGNMAIASLGAACEAAFPQGALHTARLAMACAAELMGTPWVANALGDTADLSRLVARREEFEAALGVDVGLSDLADALQPRHPAPFPVDFPAGFALAAPVRVVADARRREGQSWDEAARAVVEELLPPLRARLIGWALGPSN